MAVSSDKVIHYTINTINTTSNVFKNFMKELLDKMTDEEKKTSIFILDNCFCYLIREMFELYYKQKLKILFGIPYMSNFNLIENMFGVIKNNTYRKLYKDYKSLIADIPKIIEEKIKKDQLNKMYKNILREYYDFIIKHKINNLNE